MKTLINNNIQKMKPYQPPIEGRRAFGGLLLNFNERTTPFGDCVIDALKKLANENKIQVYPEYDRAEKTIAQYVGVKSENIMLTNGSNQGIDIIFRAFTKAEDRVIIPSPSFTMFYQCAEMVGNKILMPQYDENQRMSFPMEEILRMVAQKPKLIVICNPNNPTGTLITIDKIEKILQKAENSIVYVDEAYYEFSRTTAVSLLSKYKNLVITRTFSKAFGLAALRIGYIIANSKIIQEMKKIRGPYDINMPAVYGAAAVLKNRDKLKIYVREVMQKSKPMLEKFFTANNTVYYPSGANFILFRPNNSKT
ncbi:histidinol-phosphate aminotransferase family protein, partial [Candidatus Falkowbacteria bacterium]|nr:histidinol-phosphate aminotransferase family protein [Candidatus Falkowbacteria bacterium]